MLIVDEYREERVRKFFGVPLAADRWEMDELLILIYIQISMFNIVF